MTYFENDKVKLYLGDCLEVLETIDSESVDMIFADPPYFLSDGKSFYKDGKLIPIDKGDWDKAISFEEKHSFNRNWIRACRRVLKPNGTIFVSGTYHNIFSCGVALEQEGFSILNNITWQKKNPPPNFACRYFTHSTENIIWAKKSPEANHTFNYKLMKELNNGKQQKDVIEGNIISPSEKKFGKHPTQKPKYLLDFLIKSASNEGDLILDPFAGSSTTGVSAVSLGRRYIGIDKSEEYLELSKKRLEDIMISL